MSGSNDGAQVFTGAQAATPGQATLVTIGNFDGVHRGHSALLTRVVQLAQANHLAPVVLTFEPHPNAVLGRQVPPLLTPLERKLELILRQAPSVQVVVEPFTRELAGWSPRAFAQQLLAHRLKAQCVVVGEGFRFGAERSGDMAALRLLGERFGFSARSAPLEEQRGGAISSTRIRQALRGGDVAAARALLGRPHSVSGEVVRGQQFARTLGVPSANLANLREQIPGRGVYAVLVDLRAPGPKGGYGRLGTGVANVGVRPTGGSGELRVEVHIHDHSGNLYGRHLRVHFAERLRNEERFEDTTALVRQLRLDVARSRADLATQQPDPGAGGAWH